MSQGQYRNGALGLAKREWHLLLRRQRHIRQEVVVDRALGLGWMLQGGFGCLRRSISGQDENSVLSHLRHLFVYIGRVSQVEQDAQQEQVPQKWTKKGFHSSANSRARWSSAGFFCHEPNQ